MSTGTENLIERFVLYKEIATSSVESRDAMLGWLTDPSKAQPNPGTQGSRSPSILEHAPVLNGLREAKAKLNKAFPGKFVRRLLASIRKRPELEAMISGSLALYSVDARAAFQPGDIDFYIKDFSMDKAAMLQDCVQEAAGDNCRLIVFRQPIVLTWLVVQQREKGDKVLHKVQCNVLALHSWTEFLATCHSDLLAVGFDVQRDRFVYLARRFLSAIASTQGTTLAADRERGEGLFKTHFFSNALNCDSSRSLRAAAEKYRVRGYRTDVVVVSGQATERRRARGHSGADHESGYLEDEEDALPDGLMDVLLTIPMDGALESILLQFRNTNNLAISTCVRRLKVEEDDTEENFPILDLFRLSARERWKTRVEGPYVHTSSPKTCEPIRSPVDVERFLSRASRVTFAARDGSSPNGSLECSVLIEEQDAMLKGRCGHRVSLLAVLKDCKVLRRCPICRNKNFLSSCRLQFNSGERVAMDMAKRESASREVCSIAPSRPPADAVARPGLVAARPKVSYAAAAAFGACLSRATNV